MGSCQLYHYGHFAGNCTGVELPGIFAIAFISGKKVVRKGCGQCCSNKCNCWRMQHGPDTSYYFLIKANYHSIEVYSRVLYGTTGCLYLWKKGSTGKIDQDFQRIDV